MTTGGEGSGPRTVQGRNPRGGGGQARTRLARAAVVQAARTLFLDRGYAATTIEAISGASDVPAATVYRLFSSKLGILKALIDVSIAGDDEAVPLQDRASARELFAEADPGKQLAGFASICREINERSGAVYQILLSASGSDPEAASLLSDYTRKRQEGQGQIARSLARDGVLQTGLTQRDAADLIHALMSPELYRLLVSDRGWAPGRYQRWLAGTLVSQLLDGPPLGWAPQAEIRQDVASKGNSQGFRARPA